MSNTCSTCWYKEKGNNSLSKSEFYYCEKANDILASQKIPDIVVPIFDQAELTDKNSCPYWEDIEE